jgi:hypothetical protein
MHQDDSNLAVGITGLGAFFTAKNGGVYESISLSEIAQMVDAPPSIPDKKKARWLIPSTYPSREHKVQLESGEFHLLWADIDSSPGMDALKNFCDGLFCDYELYSSRSATEVNQKARILIPLSHSLTGKEYRQCSRAINDLLADGGIEPDRATERTGQICYLPNRGDFYQSFSERTGDRFNPLVSLRHRIDEAEAEDARAEAETQAKIDEANKKRKHIKPGESLIETFNAAYLAEEILIQAGYAQRGTHFRHPNSDSGSFSASVKNGRVYSLSPNDHLYTGDKGAHDAFSTFVCLFHGGDEKKALQDAGQHWVMINGRPWDEVKRAEWAKEKNRSHQKSGNQSHDSSSSKSKPKARLVKASTIKPIPIEWLWGGYLAKGKLHVIAGQPGTGKTTLFISLIAAITSGGTLPDDSKARMGNVIIWSGEDSVEDTLVPRLIAAGADLRKVFFIDAYEGPDVKREFDPSTDIDSLYEAVNDIDGGISMLLVDPIVSVVSGDSHKNAEVRKGLAPLVEFGEKTGASVVGISHFTKSTQGKEPIERIVGSIAFGAVARVVFAAATLPENDAEGGSRLFCRVKSNIGPDSGGFKYDLAIAPLFEYPEIAASSVVWGSQVEGSAKDLLSGEDGNKEDENLSPCAEWLKELLTYGAKSKQEIDDAAREIGWTTKQVLTAKTKLRVESRKRGFSEGWFWSLREGTFKNE